MSHLYRVNKSHLPNGIADMLGLRAQVEADLTIPPKQDADPQFVTADEIEFSFAGALDEEAGEIDNLTAVVAAHDGTGPQLGRPSLEDGTPVVVSRPTYVDGLGFVERSLACICTPPLDGEVQTIIIADYPITTEIRISGGEYQIGSAGAKFHDRISFGIVDKDGLIYAMSGGTMGLPAEGEPGGGVYTVHRFVDRVHMCPDYRGVVSVQGEGMNTISAGFYLRMQVESNTERGAGPLTQDDIAEIVGRFKVYE